MNTIQEHIRSLDWAPLSAAIHDQGYAIIPGLLPDNTCDRLTDLYDRDELFRKTVVMARHHYGEGEYRYFNYPLPELLQMIRRELYAPLSAIANTWMQALKTDILYPDNLEQLYSACQANGQEKATVLLLKYGAGGFNTLHQDIYGDVFFPLQAVLFLSQPGTDYTGGEFILTEQTPRTQSKVTALSPQKGDLMIFTTSFRPVKGVKGYHRINVKHGVSEIKSGQRYTLGIIFHDAAS